jgi:hypothetical protein
VFSSMKQSRVSRVLGVAWVLTGCQGVIGDAKPWSAHESLMTSAADGESYTDAAAPTQPLTSRPDDFDADDAGAPEPTDTAATKPDGAKPHASDAGSDSHTAPQAPSQEPTSIGSGDLQHPIAGPSPVEAAKLSGQPYLLVKNWDFGSHGNIRNLDELGAEFQYHDHFGTIANGTNYGSVTVAPDAASAIQATGLGLANDQQPVEDPAHPVREWTADTLLAHVRPLSNTQTTVSVAKHDAGNGSLTAKWKLPNGGSLLGHDVVWETRVRMPTPLPGYWFALWTAGELWNKGAEMDLLESFGAPNIDAESFHSDSVGGTNLVDYKSWPSALNTTGVPMADRNLPQWHVWTWVYLRDDSYQAYYDGYLVQHGNIHWTKGGTSAAEATDMHFLFDFSWGHTQVDGLNIELPASMFPLTYEIDYSRVYMR